MRVLFTSLSVLALAAGAAGCAMTDDYAYAPAGEVYYLAPTAGEANVAATAADPMVGATLYDGYGKPAGQIVGVGRTRAGEISAMAVRVADGSIHQVLPEDVETRNGVLITGFSAEQVEALPSTIDRF